MTRTHLLSIVLITTLHVAHATQSVVFCDAEQGLKLINQDSYSPAQIQMILANCDKTTPNDFAVLLLHGLLTRSEEQQGKNYSKAISWLQQADALAPPGNFTAKFELATTYEWANNLLKAQELYQQILTQNPLNRAALLGKARMLRMQSQFSAATLIYQNLLQNDSSDVDALNGLGWINAGENKPDSAANYFHQALQIEPANQEALNALAKISATQSQLNAQSNCQASQGLMLLTQPSPPLKHIQKIIDQCDKTATRSTDSLMLHGLLARHTQHYQKAIYWLKEASLSAGTANLNPQLELGTTYEWALEPAQAQLIYQNILAKTPQNHAALLGMARTLKATHKFEQARTIYQQLLAKNSADLDALNGLAWVELAQGNSKKAAHLFNLALVTKAHNQEAQIGLSTIKAIQTSKIPDRPNEVSVVKPLCDAERGLILLTEQHPPLKEIRAILARCDIHAPNAATTFLLHGLIARDEAKNTQHFDSAIEWLQKAVLAAARDNNAPLLELALTYEWANEPSKALAIYDSILSTKPHERAALLGQARVLRMEYDIAGSVALYKHLLSTNARDVDALNGLGQSLMANYQFEQAHSLFDEALAISPGNNESVSALRTLSGATKYVANLTGGNYSVPPETAQALNFYFFDHLNATDGLSVLATHNTKQIGGEFFSGPTLLPNNSFLLGFQRSIPNQYGWGVSYDYRQHDGLPFENRVFGHTNLYLNSNLEWFNGLRVGFPTPWNNQLLYSGLTVYTLPINISLTGFWAHQEIGGKSSSYALDFGKEYANHFLYNIGPSYSPTQKNWELHGKIVVPTFTNQAFLADCSHYFFNSSTFINIGWQFYWA